LNSFLRKYTEEANLPAILGDFLRDNAMTFDDLYQALRYPSDRNFQTLKTYIELKYKGTKVQRNKSTNEQKEFPSLKNFIKISRPSVLQQ